VLPVQLGNHVINLELSFNQAVWLATIVLLELLLKPHVILQQKREKDVLEEITVLLEVVPKSLVLLENTVLMMDSLNPLAHVKQDIFVLEVLM